MSSQSLKKILLGALGACSMMATTAWSAPSNVLLNPFNANTFVVLPDDLRGPEGIAFVPDMRALIVGTLNPLNPAVPGTGVNSILRYGTNGQLQARLPITNGFGTISMLFNPRDAKVYFVSPLGIAGGDTLIQRVPANFTDSTPIETVAVIPNIEAPAVRINTSPFGLQVTTTFSDTPSLANGLAFRDSDGALFVADSLQGAIFQIADPSAAVCASDSSCVALLRQDPLLLSGANPLLGANSVLVSPDESLLYITNTGDDRVLTLNVQSGDLAVFAESVQGADGLALGPDNTLLVSAFLGNEVVVLDLNGGRVLAKLGGFRGINNRGVIKGLLGNGSIAMGRNFLFATNLALPDGEPGSAPEANSPANDVERGNIARINIPKRFRR